MGATPEREPASGWRVPAWVVGAVVWPAALGLGAGLALAAVRHWEQVADLVVANRVDAAVRASFFAHAVLAALAGPLAVLLLARWRRPRSAPLLERAASLGRRLAPLTPITLLPFLLHLELWRQQPLFMEVVGLVAAAALAWLVVPDGDDLAPAAVESRGVRLAWLGGVLVLAAMPAARRRRFLLAAVALAALNSYHHGLVGPRRSFKAGFGAVDFAYSALERARYQELLRVVALIPPDASVTANEELVPHVARRRRVETLRYAQANAGRFSDYYLLLQDDATREQLVVEYPEVASLAAYELVEQGEHVVLLRRRG